MSYRLYADDHQLPFQSTPFPRPFPLTDFPVTSITLMQLSSRPPLSLTWLGAAGADLPLAALFLSGGVRARGLMFLIAQKPLPPLFLHNMVSVSLL